MARLKRKRSGGGWHAIRYTLAKGREAGGIWKLYRAMRTKNACKTCALGMGGQRGGMVNELGHFPEVCKKSLQAMVADMQGAISPDFWKRFPVAQLKQFTPRELEHCGRLVTPVLYQQGESHYRPIPWSEAFQRITAKLKELSAEETFWYFSGRSSNEAGFLLQLFARLYGTNNVNNCSYYCHQASGVGLASITGSGTATLLLEDVENADVVFLIGGNPASNHPRLMRTLMQVRRQGGQVIVVNPVVETGLVNFKIPSDVRSLLFGSKIASQYVQVNIGGDMALLVGIAKRLDELGAVDEVFLTQHCQGWPEWAASIREARWEDLTAQSGVSRDQIDRLAEIYAGSKRAVFGWTMGITHHLNGVENVQAIGNLALMRGMVGKPGAGLMPIRGHSNVQGIGSVGVTPKLKEAIFTRLQDVLGVTLPTTPGLDTLACMEGATAGRQKLGFCLGGNLYGSNPDSQYADRALSNLDMLVQMNTTLNTGHAHGLAAETIILPVLARDEEPQPTTQESMFNYIRFSDGGPGRLDGPKSEIEVIATIARGVLGDNPHPIDWHAMGDAKQIRQAIAKIVPGFEPLSEIDRTKAEFQIDGRTFHQPRFATPDGKARLHVVSPPALVDAPNTLRLMTVRSEGQFNTVVYEDDDIYRGVQGRDVILLHPVDIERLGLNEQSKVTVESDTGSLPNIQVHRFDQIKPGNALMYYPEANVLVGREVDPHSRTPAFKNIVVRLRVEG